MCDFKVRLTAWIDQELPTDEASEVERHVVGCEECRCSVAKYREVSERFVAYCDAVAANSAPRRVAGWMPVLVGALAAAAVLVLALPRTRVTRQMPKPAVATASESMPQRILTEPSGQKIAVRRHQSGVRRPQVRHDSTVEQPMEAAIQIVIPAEAMFPPGALPSGVSFIADLRIAPDGSVQQVRLRQ